MRIRNVSRDNVLTQECKYATRFRNKLLGLIVQKNPPAMMFDTRFGIHTFFLREPIDVVVLDSSGCVCALRVALRPFRLYFWNPRLSRVIELPSGTLTRNGTQMGDQLEFIT
jgi:uncharacterized protein